ncbi:MAG: hypothetical protein ACRDVG_07740, partial [Jatrophihabitantaceae bacterium]
MRDGTACGSGTPDGSAPPPVKYAIGLSFGEALRSVHVNAPIGAGLDVSSVSGLLGGAADGDVRGDVLVVGGGLDADRLAAARF